MRDRSSVMIWLLFKAGQRLGRFEPSNSEIAASACCIFRRFSCWELELETAIKLSDDFTFFCCLIKNFV